MEQRDKLREYILEVVKKENNRPIPEKILIYKLAEAHREELGYIKTDDVQHAVKKLVGEHKLSITHGGSIVEAGSKSNYDNKNRFNRNDKRFSHDRQNNRYENPKYTTELEKETRKGYIHINASGNGFISINENEKAQ
jgi:hypothetical protein